MRLYGSLYIMLLCSLIACNDEPISSPVDWGKAPGMPNWYSPEYDWIDLAYENCFNMPLHKLPYIINVADISPDGQRALLVYQDQYLLLYNMKSSSVELKIGEELLGFYDARWSNNGQYIIASRGVPNKVFTPLLYNVATKELHNLSIPDSNYPLGGYFLFLPGDSSLLAYRFNSDFSLPTQFISIDLTDSEKTDTYPINDAVGNIAAVSSREVVYFKHNFSGPTYVENVEIKARSLENLRLTYSAILPDVSGVGRSQLSRDGNWLAAFVGVRLPNSRFLSASTITGLGIIDLRPGSPYRYKMYAFYPDHTNAHKLCVSRGSLFGSAWSLDNRYVYHEQIRLSDTTVQIVRREVSTGRVEVLTDFKGVP